MSYTAEQPIQYTPDPSKFGALAGGKVWFGVPNGNPASVPGDRIQVYLARQGLADLAIAQPIDIGPGGVWYYSGSPAQIKVLVPYCVQILNSLGVQKFYAPAAGDEIEKFNEIDNKLDAKPTIVATYADISSALNSLEIGQQISLVGHTIAGTGGGIFDVVSSASLTANNGTVVINGSKAAVRKTDGYITVSMFGAYPGASRATNDTAFYNAYNSGFKTVKIPSGTYLRSTKDVITATSLGISIQGEDLQNTILSWQIDTATSNKFAFLLDAFVSVGNLTIENTGNDLASSGGIVSYTPTAANGLRDSRLINIRLKGWHAGMGASINGTSLTMVQSLFFSNYIENVIYDGCYYPIKLGNSCNANVFNKVQFLHTKGPRHIYMLEGSTNTFITPQFEPVDASVTSGFLNAELVRSPNCTFLNAYLEPCYGFVADSSPGTHIDNPLIEGFDFTVGTLSNNAILRSTDVSNAGVYSAPMVSRVSTPVSRATVNPTSYCASDDNANTLTLVDKFTTRDTNFKLKPAGQTSKFGIYRHESWTPTITGSAGGGAGNVYSQQSGIYSICGNLVTAWFRLLLTAKDGALAGNVQISTPYKIANIVQYTPSGIFSEFKVDLDAGYTVMQVEGVPNTNTCLLIQGGDNINPLPLPVSGLLSTSILIGQISFITDDA